METCSSLKQDKQHFLVIPRSCSLALNIFLVHSYLGPRPSSWRLQSANVTRILPITNTRRILSVDTMTGSSSGQWARWVTALHHQTFSHQSDHTRKAGTSSKKFNPLIETRTFFFPPRETINPLCKSSLQPRWAEQRRCGAGEHHSSRRQIIRQTRRQRQTKQVCKGRCTAGQKSL